MGRIISIVFLTGADYVSVFFFALYGISQDLKVLSAVQGFFFLGGRYV